MLTQRALDPTSGTDASADGAKSVKIYQSLRIGSVVSLCRYPRTVKKIWPNPAAALTGAARIRAIMRVLLAGGGSGGSATPVLAVAEVLRTRDPSIELLYIGTSAGPERDLVEAAGIPFQSVPAGKLRRYFSVQNVWDVGNLALGLTRSLMTVRRFKPDVGFGAGGFACVPPLWAARLSGVPIHIHQQDAIPGLANRLLAPAATSISVTFEETLRHFPGSRTSRQGNPVRPSVLAGDRDRFFKQFDLDPKVPLVLVTGGGTGALKLNQLVARASARLVEHTQIVHLTGQGRAVDVQLRSPRYVERPFFVDEMADALHAATVVVSRAGLGTLSEIAALGLPAIVVPMPRSHQGANARIMHAHGAAVVLDEDLLTPEKLIDQVLQLIASAERRNELSIAVQTLLPADAAERIADRIEELGHSRARDC
ncbi:MAG TPA: undecaprenyldiphospho-muramoylpentapeptide beta-N-acetylglucosaminyltransferase [Chloroflexota bacterium]|jgi:UDP-N-acetylglucosamine--N-acetylmuramyl-(pentapeptide) pyrophosphoryl-undecaprenol N-acetylglucosamine transferase|nr:undecaprenyldiphospho-muramoylpentapeptide beta-N-acetylglucosaminyltransferase [Chloroflexota bacterium]